MMEFDDVANMAIRLGDQTQSEADRVECFTLLLARHSFPRLDVFGLSAGKVRARVTELLDIDEEMDYETAFVIAVLEEGTIAMKELGDMDQTQRKVFLHSVRVNPPPYGFTLTCPFCKHPISQERRIGIWTCPQCGGTFVIKCGPSEEK
jgi:Zn finger protein HypA/HybF involved in hydrogenase expression